MATLSDLAVEIAGDIKASRWTRRTIESGEDMNTLTDPGVYTIPLASVATTLLNGPADNALGPSTVEVFTTSSLGRVQRWTVSPGATGRAVITQRHRDFFGDWSEWGPTAWLGGSLGSSTDLATLAPGLYRVVTGGTADALGLPTTNHGTIEVGDGTNRPITWRTAAPYTEVWGNAVVAGTLRNWVKIGPYDPPYTGGTLTSSSDLTALAPGIYEVTLTSVAEALELPTINQGTVEVTPGTNRALIWRTAWSPSETWQAAIVNGELLTWGKIGPYSAPPSTSLSSPFEHEVRLSELRRRRGPVTVTTPAVVVLAWDHGLTNVKDTVLALHEARNLPTTLAINSELWDDPLNAGATQTDVQAWVAGGLVEVANHGRTHTYPSTTEGMVGEYRGGREDLEAQLGAPIDTYQMAGSAWGGSIADLGLSERGQIVMSSHAIVTGMIDDGTTKLYPIDGHPTIGTHGYWIDRSTTAAEARIEDAITAGKTVVIRFHPQFLDQPDYLTTAGLTAFLDYVAGKVTAGEVTVLQMRDAMIAQR